MYKKNSLFLGALLFGLLVLLGAGCRGSEERYGNNMMEHDQMIIEKYVMKDGKMMTLAEDEKLRPMTVDVTLSDGTKIMMDGKIMKKDGSTMMLKEGEGVNRDGMLKMIEQRMMEGEVKKEMPENEMMKKVENTSTEKMMMDSKAKGSYQVYDASKLALAEKGSVVLFFHAPWCPVCRAIETNIQGSSIPDGLTILKVDFDTATELRKKYGVTVQHTFVQVDKNGNSIKKWSGASGGGVAEIAAQVQ